MPRGVAIDARRPGERGTLYVMESRGPRDGSALQTVSREASGTDEWSMQSTCADFFV